MTKHKADDEAQKKANELGEREKVRTNLLNAMALRHDVVLVLAADPSQCEEYGVVIGGYPYPNEPYYSIVLVAVPPKEKGGVAEIRMTYRKFVVEYAGPQTAGDRFEEFVNECRLDPSAFTDQLDYTMHSLLFDPLD